MSNSSRSYPQDHPGDERDALALREYVKRVRLDPNFGPAMELVRRFGRVAIGELERKWGREVERMYAPKGNYPK